MAPSSSKPLGSPRPAKKIKVDDHEGSTPPNWLDLPRDVTVKILCKVGAIDMMMSAEHVCSDWQTICMDPLMWRTIDMPRYTSYDVIPLSELDIMCRRAIDRSCGQLENICLEGFATNDLLSYIADRASHLRSMRLQICEEISDETLIEVAKKLPLLEELELSHCSLSSRSLEAVGIFCPLLRLLKFNYHDFLAHREDDVSFVIAKNMPKLQHLELVRNIDLNNAGLLAILDGCPLLESLNLQYCFNIGLNLEGSLGKRCAEQIKELRLPR